MTRVHLNGTIKGLSGRIGNLIFRQLPDGTTVVTSAQPKKNSRQKKRAKLKRSPRQQGHNDRFEEASAYAKWAQTQPIYAELAAAAPMKTAYNFALSDWWHAPKIHQVECRENKILIQATDNVLVTKVRVTVLDEEGKVMEKGEAIRGEGDCWEFTPTAEGKTIQAEAWDLPGHVTRVVA